VAPVEACCETQACGAALFLTYGCAVRGSITLTRTPMAVHGGISRLGAASGSGWMWAVSRGDRTSRNASTDERSCGEAAQRLARGVVGWKPAVITQGAFWPSFLAFERLLDAHPELIGKVSLLTICVPAARR